MKIQKRKVLRSIVYHLMCCPALFPSRL